MKLQDKDSFSALASRVVWVVVAIQFVHILDFMMVAPLAPDFVRGISIEASDIGYITGSYGVAASISTVIAAFIVDRFERRVVIAVAMFGLACGTVLASFANDLSTMIAGRVVAGFFGGPAVAVAMAMIIDVVPDRQRGRAMGIAMGAFSIASVLGVPLGLELARWYSWQTPFYFVAALAIVVIGVMFHFVPRLDAHKLHVAARKSVGGAFTSQESIATFAMTAVGMVAAFLLIPNISTFVQFNLGFPRDQLALLYLMGGALSFFVVRYAGRLLDAWGSRRLTWMSALLTASVIFLGFAVEPSLLPAAGIFAGFMIAMSIRNVISTTLASKVPRQHERAGFMSFNSAIQHVFAAIGAMLSSLMLSTNADGVLQGMPVIAMTAIFLTLCMPFFVNYIERRLALRAAGAQASP